MCGVFGIAGHEEAANMVYLGLYALQHRGQESAGIFSTDGAKLYKTRRRSLVEEAFDEKSFDVLKGNFAIGHVRYSTTGSNSLRNVQPMVAAGAFGELAVSHNGNITNFQGLKHNLEKKGAIFQSTSDTEVILHLIAHDEGPELSDKVIHACEELEGAFSLVLLSPKHLIALRDPWGFRPLSMGKMPSGAVVFSSESCAFDLIGATFERDVLPGEMIVVDHRTQKVSTRMMQRKEKPSACSFEHVYFARPDSQIFGQSVYDIRKKLGIQLAKEYPLPQADLVMPVPDSGMITALGYAQATNKPFELGLIRNHYVGRTFIEPKQSIRGFGVKVKLNPVSSQLKGKSIVVIDDSIVRGTTSQKIIKMLRDAGAARISLLIASPPFIAPCVYGIDTPCSKELIASKKSTQEIAEYVGADEVGYLSLEGLKGALNVPQYCFACFTGKYPTNSLPLAQVEQLLPV